MHPTPVSPYFDESVVYKPAEDTYCLLDGLEKEYSEVDPISYPKIVMEIGSGSGCISSFVGQILSKSPPYILTTDINPIACKVTMDALTMNKVENTGVLNTYLASGIKLKKQVDIIIFNPPYVPVKESEDGNLINSLISHSWAGGEDGNALLYRVIKYIDDLLTDDGRFYTVIFHRNNISEVCKIYKEKGFSSRIVLERKTVLEKLSVLCFTRIIK